MILKLFMLGLRHRFMVSLIILIISLFATVGLSRLEIDTSVDSLIPARDPARIIYQRIMGEFGTDNKTIIYIKDKDIWTPAKLAKLEKLHRVIEKIEHVSRVDSLFSLHTIEGKEGKIDSRPLIREAPKTEEEALSARKSALANPLYRGNFFSDDGDVAAIIVSVTNIEDDKDFSRTMFESLENILSTNRADFEVLVQVGPPRINAELKSSLFEDFKLLGPLSAFILVVSILLFMGSGISAFVPIVTSSLTILWTFGMLGWTGIPLNIFRFLKFVFFM